MRNFVRRSGAIGLWVWLAPLIAAAALPAGYIELTYIESTRTSSNSEIAQQYLDTGYTPQDAKLGFELDFVFHGGVKKNPGNRIMGSSTKNGNYGLFIGAYSDPAPSGGVGGQFYFCNSPVKNPYIKGGVRQLLVLRNKQYWSYEISEDILSTNELGKIDSLPVQTSDLGYDGSIWLGSIKCGTERADLRAVCTFYRFKIYDGDTLLHDFVPAQSPDGVAGLYDIVGELGFKTSNDPTNYPFTPGDPVDLDGGTVTINPVLVATTMTVGGSAKASGSFIAAGSEVTVTAHPLLGGERVITWEKPLPAGAVTSMSGEDAVLTFTMGLEPVTIGVRLVANATKTLPTEYRLLEYIESTGTQWIDTGVKISSKVAMELELALTPNETVKDQCNYSGAALNQSQGWLCVGDYGKAENKLGAYFANGTRAGAEIPYDSLFHYYYCGNGFQCVDTTTAESKATFSSANCNLYLLDANIEWTATHLRQQQLKSCIIYEDGAVVRNFVPALELATETPGLYDVQNGGFYRNANPSSSDKFAYQEVEALTVVGNPVEVGSPVPDYGLDLAARLDEERTYTFPNAGFPFTNAEQTVICTGLRGYTLTLKNGVSYSGEGNSTSFVYTTEHYGATLAWNFSTLNRLTYSADSEHGSVLGPASGFYAPGAEITLRAKPGKGAKFLGWQGVAEEHQLENPLTLVVGETPLNVVARFEPMFEPTEEECSTKELVVSIIGDSYSSYSGYNNGGTGYYPKHGVSSVEQMWWHQVIKNLGAKLGVCDASGGTTLGYKKKDSSFLSRVRKLDDGANGTPDIIFVFGGANDQDQGAGPGEYLYDPATWNNTTLVSFRPACAAMINYLRNLYPKARIYFVVNAPATADCVYLDANYIESMKTVCAHYDVPAIELHDIERVERHPTAAGMEAIAEQVTAAVKADFAERANYGYNDGCFYSNDAALGCQKLGKEYIYTSTNTDRRITLVARRNLEIKRSLVVGGGGAGGATVGAGGGGGGVTDTTYAEGSFLLKKGDRLTLVVGAGGGYDAVVKHESSSEPVTQGGCWQQGVSGLPSILSTNGIEVVRSGGGGGGGSRNSTAGRAAAAGGSSGGGANGGAAGAVTGSGHAGANGPNDGNGGGGGAQTAGEASKGTKESGVGGKGGEGVTSDITGVELCYGGGGGGGTGNYNNQPQQPGAAGDASAGAGGALGEVGGNGADGFGGGGGGGGYSTTAGGFVGGKGGNGAVILRVHPRITGGVILVR